MREFCYKRWVKITAFLLCVISFNAAACSLYVILLGESYGMYGQTKEVFRERAYDKICSNYSVAAVAAYQDGFRMDELLDTNFRYGVIQTDDLSGLDLNDGAIYEVCNFDRKITEDMLYVHSYSMGNSTEFYVGDSLFDSFYIYNGNRDYEKRKSLIEEYYYVRDTDRFYCLANGKIYYTPGYEGYGYQDRLVPVVKEGEKTTYDWADGQEQISFDGQTRYLSEIPILLEKDLRKLGTVISENGDDADYEDFYIESGYVVTYDKTSNTTPYYVVSYVSDPLEAKGGFFEQNIFGKIDLWEQQDYFVQAEALIEAAYAFHYGWYGIFVVSLVLFLLSSAALLTGAGHHNGKEVVLGWADRIPYDAFLTLLFLIGSVFASIAIELAASMSVYMLIPFGAVLIFLEELIVILCVMSTAARLKSGFWWRNTICWRIWNRCRNAGKKILERFGRAVPLVWKAWIFMAALAVLELIGVTATSYCPGEQVFLWFIEKAILYALLTAALLQMRKLQQAGKKLAAGELSSRLDTSRMFWDFKAHGENLNSIQDGIERAVEKQMKSEYFKTELITNVSHDIKTPLTSIINYVDLLKKEESDNPKAKEYLEVLSRQSARLKKLIEDLMEASKASTGNLNVVFERCDAHVMLTQTIGEFEEKLKEGQIELIVKGSRAPLLIQADPRHLWRIFDNMMNNICKYAQPLTRAYVNIETQGDTGKIIFRNISKYALNIGSEELMERFVRGDSSRNTEGSGLGLSIAKSLTELMHGTFELVVDGDLFKVIISFPVFSDAPET